ncbi:hypothetical protein Pcinc_043113 [Petrolisthes cinctipes]|uniref:Uncharacterized protein n=1 Tax=Petrolisthes cinctipes TaxID=88211 RepID=A0AAE1BH16_PETCI|nr:hypothetical protein Pcinc_043113 [Petrolisthes cinctipes]
MGQRQDHLVQEDCLGEGSGCSNDVGDSRSFTITLKPGRYRVNVQWRSKTHPFRIRLTPNKKKRCEAPPPTEQQPLYYSNCESHHEQHTTPSLPRRLVHRLLSHQSTSPSPSSSCHHQHNACTLPFPSLQEQLAQHQHSLLQQQVGFQPCCLWESEGAEEVLGRSNSTASPKEESVQVGLPLVHDTGQSGGEPGRDVRRRLLRWVRGSGASQAPLSNPREERCLPQSPLRVPGCPGAEHTR